MLIISLSWMACEDETPVPLSDLDGEWHLVSISCLCPTAEFEIGESIWTFDVAGGTLDVDNSVQVEGYALQSGAYGITVDETNGTISEISGLGCNYEVETDGEVLNIMCQVATDGPWYTLVRDGIIIH